MTIDTFLTDHRFWLLIVCVAVFALYARHRPSGYSLMGLAAYVVSVCLFNLWTFAPYEFETEQQALDVWARQWEFWSLGLNGVLLMYLTFVVIFLFRPPHKDDLLAKVIWGILLISEAWALGFENYVCNIVYATPGSEVLAGMMGEQSIYACGRIYGDTIVWIPTALQIALMLWAVWAHDRAKKRIASLGR